MAIRDARAATQKITIEVPSDLLERAQKATGEGVTGTGAKGCACSHLATPSAN